MTLIIRDNEEIALTLFHFRYTLAAQDLIVAARGQPYHEGKRWRATDDGGKASTDDITVFVIPLKFALSVTNDEDDVELLQ